MVDDQDTKDPDGATEPEETGPKDPRELFQQVSRISITMCYDLIDKLRFFEKETMKLSDEEIEQRLPHMTDSLDGLRKAYLTFADIDF